METYTIKIEGDTPETMPQYLSEVMNSETLNEESKNAWNKAIAAGAISSKEFHARLENEIRNNW